MAVRGRDGGRAIEFHLIRHPRAAVADGICYGASDIALAEDPAASADRLRALLPPRYRLVSSPAQRCLRLAELLHAAPLLDARLRELDFGAWEMRTFADIPRAAIDAWAADALGFRPPGGESVAEMRLRVVAALEDLLAHGDDDVVIVAHGGPLRVIAGALLGLPDGEWMRMHFEFGCVTRVDVERGAVRLAWHRR